jgi:hypothetical protein
MSDEIPTTEHELLPVSVMPLYASMDSVDAPSRALVQFAHRLIEDAAISGGDLEPTTIEQGDLAVSVARALTAETERCAKIADACYVDIKNNPHDFGALDTGGLRASEKIASAIRCSHE